MTQVDINNIRNLIANNNIKDAISNLNKVILGIQDNDLRNTFILKSANYAQVEREDLQGITTSSTARNQTIISILQIVDEIESILPDNEKKINSSLEGNANDTISNLVDIFEKEINALDERSTKEDLQEIDNIRHRLFESVFGKFDRKIKFDTSIKNRFSQMVFDKIYASEIIDEITKLDILKIREDKANYTWVDRSIIVYALSLSSIQTKNFDPSKINLLLDFMSDFENEVWQRALVGLVLSLLINNNKWQRFDYLKKRLSTLQTIEDVQDGLHSIEMILRREYYKVNFFDKKIFEIDYYVQSPMNYFLPFYKENPIIEHCINRMVVNDVDYEELIAQVSNLPYIDSYKYLLFWGLTDGSTVKLSTQSDNKKSIMFLNRVLNLSGSFFPYHNLLSEYYFFYKFFPAKYIDEFISNQTSIYSTKLKDVILNNVNKLILLADNQIIDKKIKGAIHSLEEAAKLSSNREDIRYNLAACYLSDNQYKKAEKIFSDLLLNNPKDIKVNLNLGICFREMNKNEKSETCFEFVLKNNPKNVLNLVEYAELKGKQKEYDQAISLLSMAKSIQPENTSIIRDIGNMYLLKEDFQNALAYHLKAKELGPSNKWQNIVDLATTYMNLGNFEMSLSYSNRAIELKPKEYYSWVIRSRVYLSSREGLDRAKKDILKALSLKKENIVYGNLGHILLCLGDKEKAIEAYKECVSRFEDVELFIDKFNSDTKFIILHNITPEEYFMIREEMINYRQNKFEKKAI